MVECPHDLERDRAGGPAHADRRNQSPRNAGDLLTDERHDQDVRTGRRLRDRDELRELRAGHPLIYVDGLPMHLRQGRNRPPNGQEREQRKLQREREQDAAGILHALLQTRAIEIGTSTIRTASIGHCNTPTPTRAATAIRTAPSPRRGKVSAMETAVAISRPAAAAARPVRAPRDAGNAP